MQMETKVEMIRLIAHSLSKHIHMANNEKLDDEYDADDDDDDEPSEEFNIDNKTKEIKTKFDMVKQVN